LCLFSFLLRVGDLTDKNVSKISNKKNEIILLAQREKKQTFDRFLLKHTGSRNNNSYPNFLDICDFEDVNNYHQVISF
jgi:hypothetical protein